MSTFKKCKVVMLPTNEKVNRGIWLRSAKFGTGQYLFNNMITGPVHSNEKYQHLYILSDEEIKEGDWVIINNEHIRQVSKTTCIIDSRCLEVNGFNAVVKTACKKIIATTHKSIFPEETKDCIGWYPQPSQSFIEKYIEEYNKGNIITEVMVEYEYLPGRRVEADPEIHGTKLKINPKDNTITIRKIKDSWTKEEVIEIMKQFKKDCEMFSNTSFRKKYGKILTYSEMENKWIEENL